MADATILNGDIEVNYLSNNRQKRLNWTTGSTGTYTINQIYSAMATLLDESVTIDDGTCFSAETPREYTIGQIDTGDTEPWYITFDLMEHVKGGALRTSGWARVQDANAGILVVSVAPGGTIVKADEGYTATHGDTDTGTILEVIDTGGTNDYIVIRPLTSGVANDFNTTSGTITSSRGAFTATQNAAATTGDMIWAGLYSLGTIDPNVHQYLYQGSVAANGNRVRLSSWNDATQDWLDNFATNGHIDTTVALKDIEVATWSIIDGGYITVLARKYGDYYASFEVAASTTSGGYNPVPLGTSTDIDNTTGIKKITYTAGAGTFVVGDIILGGTSAARGLVTAVVAGVSLDFIPIDDPQKAFTATEAISAGSTTGTNIGAPAVEGPAKTAWFTGTGAPTIAFDYTAADIDDDTVNENYGIVIDCNQNPLTQVYEWCKYATRNGETTNDLDGINGESYIGAEVYIAFSAEGGTPIAEGENVTQEVSGATGVVVAYNTAAKVMLLRDTRGTFVTGGATDRTISSGDSAGTVEMNSGAGAAVSTFAPKTASPLGTFAGGTFFGARGVLLTDYLAADANSFILTPMEGGSKSRPASFSITVSNLVGGAATLNTHDKVAVFRLTGAGGEINKTEYTVAGGQQLRGANTLVTGTITQDTPGKTTGGVVVFVDVSDAGAEYKLRYNSWSGSTFTLREITGTADTGTGATTLVDDQGAFTSGATQVYRGDCVTVGTRGSAHVKTVDNATQLTLESPGITGFIATDTYEINTLPVDTEVTTDKAYVPFIHEVATSATASQSVIYVSQVFYRGKVRNTRATTKIKPFSVDGTTTGGDVAIATIRTTDTIIT